MYYFLLTLHQFIIHFLGTYNLADNLRTIPNDKFEDVSILHRNCNAIRNDSPGLSFLNPGHAPDLKLKPFGLNIQTMWDKDQSFIGKEQLSPTPSNPLTSSH